MDNTSKRYTGEKIDVLFHPKRCIHAARCVKGLPEVFDVEERPWVNADGAAAGEIADVVETCPSGALEYVRKDGADNEQPNDETTVEVDSGDVMYVRGPLNITDGHEEIECFRASLCGCGRSGNKPFCDLSHECSS
ncbi:(4Fe-4S)-binding protein [Salibacterium lacus]|uniref:(4Fe-4S)-binding protein n=1 Tax=Salibacterium lacus TaxID=1898109 RepID=A0ABW5T6A1_9BACI